MKTRVHISLQVRDLQASLEFYSQLFGQSPTKTKPDYANFRLDAPALHLALVQSTPGRDGIRKSGNEHFGIELFTDTDFENWWSSVKKAGLEDRPEKGTVCCYAKSDKFWVEDPDGNEWEFWIRREEAEAMYESAKESACCAPGQCG